MTVTGAAPARIAPRFTRTTVVDWLSRYAAVSTTGLVLAIAIFATPSFYSTGNLRAVALQASVLGVVVLGQTVALLVRGLDMSVSAVVAMTGAIVVAAANTSESVKAVLICALLAAAVGVVNGSLVIWRKVPPFVATFAMLIVIGGARLAYTHGQTSGSVPSWLRTVGSGSWGGVPVPVVIWVVLGAVLFFALADTTWGRHIYSIGANPEAARHGGVPVTLVMLSAYVICALCAMLAGLMLSGYLGYVDQNLGTSVNLNSIAAAIVGGVAFSGGRGGVLGAAVGALLLTILINVVVVAGLPIYWQLITQGVVLIFAVTIQGLRDRWLPDA